MRYHRITHPDVNNGLGCRVTLWVSGCTHHCQNCHNQCTWDFNSGVPFGEKAKKRLFELLAPPYIKGLTLSGGDPADSPEDVIELCKEVKESFPDKDIWLYTGYTLEQIMESPRLAPIIDCGVTTIVDGPYVDELRDASLAFRGSSNQRIWTKGKDGTFRVVNDNMFGK